MTAKFRRGSRWTEVNYCGIVNQHLAVLRPALLAGNSRIRRIKMNKRIVVIAFAAGVMGGVISHYVSPPLVHAESSPREVRAQSFVLINERGTVVGTFSEEADRAVLKLFDAHGEEIWRAGGKRNGQTALLGK